jgi:hypothetical protein
MGIGRGRGEVVIKHKSFAGKQRTINQIRSCRIRLIQEEMTRTRVCASRWWLGIVVVTRPSPRSRLRSFVHALVESLFLTEIYSHRFQVALVCGAPSLHFRQPLYLGKNGLISL